MNTMVESTAAVYSLHGRWSAQRDWRHSSSIECPSQWQRESVPAVNLDPLSIGVSIGETTLDRCCGGDWPYTTVTAASKSVAAACRLPASQLHRRPLWQTGDSVATGWQQCLGRLDSYTDEKSFFSKCHQTIQSKVSGWRHYRVVTITRW